MWSDDFNDGNYEGWTVQNGTFTVKNGRLKAGPGSYNVIMHQSSVAFGTWSFDLFSNSSAVIVFIGTYPLYSSLAPNQGYKLSQGGATGYFIQRYTSDSPHGSVSRWDRSFGYEVSAFKWQHINITRSQDGHICIYDNGTLILDTADNANIPASEYFLFSGKEAIIDNIVVSNTVDIQPPAAPFYMQTWFIPSIAVIALVAIVTVVLLLRRK